MTECCYLPDIKDRDCPGCGSHFWPFQGIHITSHCRDCEGTVKQLTCQMPTRDIKDGKQRTAKCISKGCWTPPSIVPMIEHSTKIYIV
jgi:hypothetical protein